MKTVTLHPVRISRFRNFWFNWPRHKQILASVLLWASRAGAAKICFDAEREELLIYTDDRGNMISTELGAPPIEIVDWFQDYLHEIASNRPFPGWRRPSAEQLVPLPAAIEICVPDVEQKTRWRWLMEISSDSTTFAALSPR